MAYEKSFNEEFAKKLAKTDSPEALLQDEVHKLTGRMLELNSARAKMSEGFKQVLEGLADAYPEIDLKDPNLTDSHNRMARALLEVCSGLGASPEEIFSTSFPAENYNQVVILKDIEYTSLCSHHFFPFQGKVHIGYLPDVNEGGKVVGLSKLARIVDAYAQRPQLQERMAMQIMTAINEQLKPAGVMVVIEGKHGCLNCRGARKTLANMSTSALSGKFKEDQKIRKEFLSLISMKH